MKIYENFLTENPCFKANRKIQVKGLMLHSVGCPQSKAYVFMKNWNRPDFDRACVHAFIDGETGDVFQCLPWSHRGWHGGGSSNNTHIGVEMCEPSSIKYTGGSSFEVLNYDNAVEVVKRTYSSAVELFAFLCDRYGLNPLKDICSHKEGHSKGIASNHGDPEHLWKGLGLPYTMDTFRKDVLNFMNQKEKRFQTVQELPLWAQKDIQELIDEKILKGTAQGLDLSIDMVRTLILTRRMINNANKIV